MTCRIFVWLISRFDWFHWWLVSRWLELYFFTLNNDWVQLLSFFLKRLLIAKYLLVKIWCEELRSVVQLSFCEGSLLLEHERGHLSVVCCHAAGLVSVALWCVISGRIVWFKAKGGHLNVFAIGWCSWFLYLRRKLTLVAELQFDWTNVLLLIKRIQTFCFRRLFPVIKVLDFFIVDRLDFLRLRDG